MFVQRERLTVTTAADGTVVAKTTKYFTGEIRQIIYTKVDYADTVDFNVQVDDTNETVWNEANVTASKTVAPRTATHSTAGVAGLFASGGEAVKDRIAVANSRIKITIAGGGDAKSGTFDIIIGG